jgi:hypothetical protein
MPPALLLANTLPASNDGYVVAAYIVFFAIVLIYVAIMAVRLGRVERRVRELGSQTRRAADATSPVEVASAQSEDSPTHPQERETV